MDEHFVCMVENLVRIVEYVRGQSRLSIVPRLISSLTSLIREAKVVRFYIPNRNKLRGRLHA